jgi:hypothetical protein
VGTALAVGLPTDVIPNPVFGRTIAPTSWSVPVLVITAALGGLLFGTYVTTPNTKTDRTDRKVGIGGLLSFFAIGCPVCNKLVVIALGTLGAQRWFEPIQPVLAGASIILLAIALRSRLRNSAACPLP